MILIIQCKISIITPHCLSVNHVISQ